MKKQGITCPPRSHKPQLTISTALHSPLAELSLFCDLQLREGDVGLFHCVALPKSYMDMLGAKRMDAHTITLF